MKYTKHGDLYRNILEITRWDEPLADKILYLCNLPDGKGIDEIGKLLGHRIIRVKNEVRDFSDRFKASWVDREPQAPTLYYDAMSDFWGVADTEDIREEYLR